MSIASVSQRRQRSQRRLRAIHDNIRARRIELELSQLQLAERCGVDKTAVSQWERGRSAPKGDRLPAVAKALRTTIDELYREAA